MAFLHQESKERLWLVRERKAPFCCFKEGAQWYKVSITKWWYPPWSPSITDRGIAPHTQQLEGCGRPCKNVPLNEDIVLCRNSSQAQNYIGETSSRNHLPSSILGRACPGPRFFFFFRMILVSRGSVGSFWVVHLVSSGQRGICLLRSSVMNPRGNVCNFNCSKSGENNSTWTFLLGLVGHVSSLSAMLGPWYKLMHLLPQGEQYFFLYKP